MSLLVNAYCTLRALPPLAFPHEPRGRRDRGDPELAQHLNGFIGYVLSRGEPKKMTASKYHAMRHIERVRHHVSLEIADGNFDAFADWAARANALCFLPDGSLRDPAGRVLLGTDGTHDPAAAFPYPEDARERKARSEHQLAARGLRTPGSLPPVVGEGEVELRPAAEVAERALALYVVTLRAESLGSGHPIPADDIERHRPLGVAAQSPKESAFFRASAPEQQQIVDFVWRYEALQLLLWALGRLGDLPFPTAIADVPALARLMLDAGEPDFVAAARVRPAGDILDALDLHLRCHWAVRQSRLDKKPLAAALEGGAVQERHYALNWLVRFEDAAWDEVDTPT